MNFSLFQHVRRQWSEVLIVPPIRYMTITSSVAIVVSLVAIALWWSMLPPAVPLWYSRAWGSDQLANPLWLFVLPGSSILFGGMSLSLANILKEHGVFARLIVVASALVSALSLIALLSILIMVT